MWKEANPMRILKNLQKGIYTRVPDKLPWEEYQKKYFEERNPGLRAERRTK